MSNQRSFVLFVALVFIVSYLYYESFLKNQNQLEFPHLNNLSNFENQKYHILNKRSLLSFSSEHETDDFPQITANKQISNDINQSTINSKKRLKRETPIESEFLSWKFNVNVTRLNNGSSKLIEKSDQKSKNRGKGNSLKMAVYVEGAESKDSNKELQRAWGAVGDFLKKMFGTPEQLKENNDIIIEGSNYLNQFAKSSMKNETDNNKDQIAKDKKPKFLTSLFEFGGGGGNKENPPMELGSGEIENLSVDSSSVSSDDGIVNEKNEDSFTIKNLEPEEILTHKIQTPLTSTVGSIDFFNPLNESLEDFTKGLNFPAVLESKFTNESEALNKGLDAINVVDVNSSEEKAGNSINDLETFCINLLKKVTKSPKFLEEFSESEGSGIFRDGNSIKNSELNINQSEITTLETNSPEPQLGAIQNLWNRITFRFRNGERAAKMSDTFTDVPSQNTDLGEINNRFFLGGLLSGLGSGGRLNEEAGEINFLENEDTDDIPTGFSIQDCSDVFIAKEITVTTELPVLTENVEQSEKNFSSFEINKEFLLDNLEKDIKFQDNASLTDVTITETNEFKDLKMSTIEETFSNGDPIEKLEEKIQELIDSVGKDDIIETQGTTIEPTPDTIKHPNLTNMVTTETKDSKMPNIESTTFSNGDPIANLDTKIQELIDSIGKDDMETRETIKPTTDTIKSTPDTIKHPETNILLSKQITEITVNNEIDVSEVSTIIAQDFKKEPNEPDNLTSENTSNIEEKMASEIDSFKDGYDENKEENLGDTDLFPVSTILPLNEKNERVFSFFMPGSGGREITDADFSSLDINLNTNEGDSLEIFDLGSGERAIDEIHPFTFRKTYDVTTVSELSNFNINEKSNETFNEADTQDLNTISNLRIPNIDIEIKNVTLHETEINGTVLRISDTSDGKEISIYMNLDQNEIKCINCSKNETVEVYCPTCESIINEKFDPVKLEDFPVTEASINYQNQLSVYPDLNSVTLPSNQSTRNPEITGIRETCTNCDSTGVEGSVKSGNTKYQVNVTSSAIMELKKENEQIILTNLGTLTVNPDSKEVDDLKLSYKKSNGAEDFKINNLNKIKVDEFNTSRRRSARFNDEPSQIPMLSLRGARAHNILPSNWPEIPLEFRRSSPPDLQSSVSTHSITEGIAELNSLADSSQTQYDGIMTVNTENIDTDISKDSESSALTEFFGNISDFESTTKSEKTDLTEDINTTVKSQLPDILSSVTISGTVSRSDLSINPRLNLPPRRFCISASECNTTLNERCISSDGITTCDCGRAFKRNPESKKCEAIITIKTSLRLPEEQFHDDLRDKSSQLFLKKEKQSLETMWILLEHDPDLFLTVAEIDVDRFEEGSLVVNWDIKLVTDGNETVSELVHHVDEDLKELLGSSASLSNLPLNVQNASVSTFAVDPCEKRELNYCHKSAECILDEAVGFRCKCKKDYLDNSKDKLYLGEVCIEVCYPNECGDHGDCKLKSSGEKHCLCSGWYFGEKCEVSGIVVIASFAGTNIVVIFALFLAACFCRRRRRSSFVPA